jgi:hypothetical protein
LVRVDFCGGEVHDPRVATIVSSVEIARSPEDVFAYLDDLERHGEWQSQIVSSKRETDGPTGVGTRATDVRRGRQHPLLPVGRLAANVRWQRKRVLRGLRC